ncbi:hypothetical protein Vi05172_g489 [Venturia inaequalis]|nr:hypothetical protein Vi05172_g489 [Venturia inaequalis]
MPPSTTSTTSSVSSIIKGNATSHYCSESCSCCGVSESCSCVVM